MIINVGKALFLVQNDTGEGLLFGGVVCDNEDCFEVD